MWGGGGGAPIPDLHSHHRNDDSALRWVESQNCVHKPQHLKRTGWKEEEVGRGASPRTDGVGFKPTTRSAL